MTDNDINIVINAATDGFQDSIDKINNALQFDKIKRDNPLGELFKTMQRSSDSALTGMLKGTENWHVSTLKMIQDLEIRFAQFFTNRLLNDTLTNGLGLSSATNRNTAEVLSNQEKNASIIDNDRSASDLSAASHAARLIKQIQSDAAATYAGVFANLSPVLGPAAAIPAGISAVAVGAMEGLVSLDVGAWNLGSDTVAQLHQGEMVVPKNFAEGLRSGSGFGGGDSYSIHINAIDTQTGAQFIKNNAGHIASAIASQVRNFNSNVPAWKS